jgi:hypothetical protein
VKDEDVCVYVVGSTAIQPFCGLLPADTDIVITGTSSEENLISVAHRIMVYICNQMVVYRIFVQKGIIYIECQQEKIQIILTQYNSIRDFFARVDIEATCVAYDGEHVVLTVGALVEMLQRCIHVNHQNFSAETSFRLCKYANRRKTPFAIAFPHLSQCVTNTVELICGLSISVLDIHGFYFTGTLSTTRKGEPYDGMQTKHRFDQNTDNVRGLISDTFVLKSTDGSPIPLSFFSCTVSELLPEFSSYCTALAMKTIYKHPYDGIRMELTTLRSVYGLTNTEIASCIALMESGEVEEARASLTKKWTETYEKKADQTVSFVRYYEDMKIDAESLYTPNSEKNDTKTMETLHCILLDRRNIKVLADVCAICDHVISQREHMITLACAHVCHYHATDICDGYAYNPCPQCNR